MATPNESSAAAPDYSRRAALRLAAEAEICVASAVKALRYGPRVLRGRAGERAAEAMAKLGLRAASESDQAA